MPAAGRNNQARERPRPSVTDNAGGRILGIDPGLSASGFGVVEGTTVIEFGTVVTRPDEPVPHRLARLAAELEAVVRRLRPDRCAVETLFFKGGGARSVILSAEARGVILCTLARLAVAVEEVTPASIKLALTGSGRASKQQVNYMTRQLLGLDGKVSEHAADALAAALCVARRRLRFDRTTLTPPSPLKGEEMKGRGIR